MYLHLWFPSSPTSDNSPKLLWTWALHLIQQDSDWTWLHHCEVLRRWIHHARLNVCHVNGSCVLLKIRLPMPCISRHPHQVDCLPWRCAGLFSAPSLLFLLSGWPPCYSLPSSDSEHLQTKADSCLTNSYPMLGEYRFWSQTDLVVNSVPSTAWLRDPGQVT